MKVLNKISLTVGFVLAMYIVVTEQTTKQKGATGTAAANPNKEVQLDDFVDVFYDIVKVENGVEFLKVNNERKLIPDIVFKWINKVKIDTVLKKDASGEYTMKTSYYLIVPVVGWRYEKPNSVSFRLNEWFEYEAPNGRMTDTLFTYDKNVLTEKMVFKDDKTVLFSVRTYTYDGLVVVGTYRDVTVKRTFKRRESQL